jgi:neopullulanase
MNYPLAIAAMGFFGARSLSENYKMDGNKLKALDAEKFSARIDKVLSSYDREVNQVQLNLLDSHDTARVLWMLGGDKAALKLCVLFQMTMPGAPCIYYGDEIGMNSGHEPHSRAAFPWENEDQWDTNLRQFYRDAIALRRRFLCLRTGEYQPLYAHKGVFAFGRKSGKKRFIVVFNARKKAKQATINTFGFAANGEKFTVVWGEAGEYRAGESLSINGQSAIVLTNSVDE